MPDDLTWAREPRTGVDKAVTPVGTYRILFSGYDYIVTRDHQHIGRGYRQTALTIANNDHTRLMHAREAAGSAVEKALTAALADPPTYTREDVTSALTKAVGDLDANDDEAVSYGLAAINRVARHLNLYPLDYLPVEGKPHA